MLNNPLIFTSTRTIISIITKWRCPTWWYIITWTCKSWSLTLTTSFYFLKTYTIFITICINWWYFSFFNFPLISTTTTTIISIITKCSCPIWWYTNWCTITPFTTRWSCLLTLWTSFCFLKTYSKLFCVYVRTRYI